MRRVQFLLIALIIVTLLPAAGAAAKLDHHPLKHRSDDFRAKWGSVFADEFDPPQPGWTMVDNSSFGPIFHADTYNADTTDDPCLDGMSWWCGQAECSYASGTGYGNSWSQWLLYENVDVSAYTPGGGDCLILTFHGRYDSEFNFDFTYVQAYNEGTALWESLNPGYNGSSGGWFDIGLYGFVLEGATCGATVDYIQSDSTVDVRFLFVSDSGWSDEDGLYDSDGGAFNVDAVKIFAFNAGTVYLMECDQSVGVAGPPPVIAGNNWHLTQRSCLTWFSPPNSYVCDDDPDTSSLPGNLNCWLVSPLIDLAGATECTVWFVANMHYDYDDYTGTWYGAQYSQYVTLDGGSCWHNIASYIGDNERHYGFGTCDAIGWFTFLVNDLLMTTEDRNFQFAFGTQTDGAGAVGCAASNSCWFALGQVDVTSNAYSMVTPTSWGKIKSMYK